MDMSLKKLVLLPGMDGSVELLRGFAAALPEGLEEETLWYPGGPAVIFNVTERQNDDSLNGRSLSWTKILLTTVVSRALCYSYLGVKRVGSSQLLMELAPRIAGLQVGSKSDFVHALLLALTATCFCSASSVAFSQLPPVVAQHPESGGVAAGSQKHMKFDVVSIRPSRPGAGPESFAFAITPDGYKQVNAPLTYTLLMAYLPVANFPMDRIKGAPSWVEDVPYDIEAKVAPEDVPLWRSLNQSRTGKLELEAMLQEVLRDRMHLVAHKAPTSMNGYALVFKRQNPNLVPSNDRDPVPPDARPMPGGGMVMSVRTANAKSFQRFYRTSMEALAIDLTQAASATSSMIENRTELVGNFNFSLPERSDASNSDQQPDTSNDPVVPWDVHAIGLNLVSAKLASWNLVIDHIDRPSVN